MEEQKNLNNIPVNQPDVATEQKNIPTVAGALIILIVAVIVGAGLFYFLQTDNNNSIVANKFLKSKTETVSTNENETASQDQVEETPAPLTAEEKLNFDYELKKLDDQNNAISSDDFNENEMSDVNIGL